MAEVVVAPLAHELASPFEGEGGSPVPLPQRSAGPSNSTPSSEKRWNPILGTYAAAGAAEEGAGFTAEMRHKFPPSFEQAMTKVVKREGVYDPVFWRHRITKENAGPEKYSGRRRLARDARGVAEALHMPERQPSPLRVDPQWSRSEKQRDHVRGILNPEEKTTTPVHRSGRSHAHAKHTDHVRSLLHQGEEDRLAMYSRGSGRKTHPGRQGSRELCVGNLINHERAAHITESARSGPGRSVLGDAMRSGENVHTALHPEHPIPTYWSPERRQSGSSGPASPQMPPQDRSPPTSTPRPPRPQWIDHDGAMSSPPVSPPRPPRPEWLDFEKPFPARNITVPARPNWLNHENPDLPRHPSAGRPPRPDYMNYEHLFNGAEAGPIRPRDSRLPR